MPLPAYRPVLLPPVAYLRLLSKLRGEATAALNPWLLGEEDLLLLRLLGDGGADGGEDAEDEDPLGQLALLGRALLAAEGEIELALLVAEHHGSSLGSSWVKYRRGPVLA